MATRLGDALEIAVRLNREIDEMPSGQYFEALRRSLEDVLQIAKEVEEVMDRLPSVRDLDALIDKLRDVQTLSG
jgi:hypothetical protein